MRKLTLIIVCFLLCLPLFGYADNGTEYYDYSFARMSYVTGDVYIERASDMGYEQGTVNLPIVANDKLGTRDGRAEIHFGRKNYLRVDRYTHVDFASLPRKGYDRVKLNLLSGSVYLRVSFLGREKDFEVHTPDASFYILEEGLYGIKVVENSETEIHVVEGAVEAAGEEGSVLVESEKRLVASNGAFLSGPEYLYASYSDNFFEWSNSRDDLHFRAVEKAYLPAEIYEYESELAANGRWVYEGTYGYVWVPHVYHHTWRPYHYGRWLWYPVCGWTWVPYASWGWCVSHYGRWHWRFGLGWYWIPTCSWGPAWVHWYRGYDYYGWCPVSYWGYPVVVQNNYFYGRWNDRHYPVNSRALTVIHKNQLQAPRISKVALSRSQTNRLGKISLASSKPKIKGTVQRNTLTSQKASKVLARSNIRKVGKSFSSSKTLRSTSGARSSKIMGSKSTSNRSALTRKGQAGTAKNSISRSSSRTSTKALSSRSTSRKSVGSRELASSVRKRARTAIKSYPSRALSSTRSSSPSTTGKMSRSRETYPSRSSTKGSMKTDSRASDQRRNISSQKSGIERPSSKRRASRAIKQYPSRSSSTSRSSSRSRSDRYTSTPRTNSLSKSSYGSTSKYSRPSRSGYSSERSRSSSSYKSSSSSRSLPSYRSSPPRKSSSSYTSSSRSYKSSSSYKSSPRSTSRGRVSSRSSSSSSRSSRSYTKSNRSSSSYRSSSSKGSSRSSSPSRGRTSSGSKSTRSVSKSSTRVKKK
ncbi:MAG: hypothetical protein PVI66_07045 [Candidatus Aminicenantes bacterium]